MKNKIMKKKTEKTQSTYMIVYKYGYEIVTAKNKQIARKLASPNIVTGNVLEIKKAQEAKTD